MKKNKLISTPHNTIQNLLDIGGADSLQLAIAHASDPIVQAHLQQMAVCWNEVRSGTRPDMINHYRTLASQLKTML